jgi:hypothetical protein
MQKTSIALAALSALRLVLVSSQRDLSGMLEPALGMETLAREGQAPLIRSLSPGLS